MHQRSLTNTEMSGDCHLVKLRIKRARIISRFGMYQRDTVGIKGLPVLQKVCLLSAG